MAKNEAAALMMKLEHARAKASKLLTLIDLATNEGGRVDERALEQLVRDAAAPAKLSPIQITAAVSHSFAVLGSLEILALVIGGFTTNDIHEGLSGSKVGGRSKWKGISPAERSRRMRIVRAGRRFVIPKEELTQRSATQG